MRKEEKKAVNLFYSQGVQLKLFSGGCSVDGWHWTGGLPILHFLVKAYSEYVKTLLDDKNTFSLHAKKVPQTL
jgi:hypothetical protein